MLSYGDYLLVKLAEECAEVQQRVMKLLQFGPGEVQEGQDKTNLKRLRDEVNDLVAVIDICEGAGALPTLSFGMQPNLTVDKAAKMKKYLELSRRLGRVAPAKHGL